MQCRSALTRIDAMRTGELPAREAGEVTRHLHTCETCDASVEDVERLARVVRTLSVTPPRPGLRAASDRFDSVEAGDGTVWVAFTAKGLTMIHADGTAETLRERYMERYGRDLEAETLPDRLRRQVAAAFSGAGVRDPVVDFDGLTEFERDVLRVLTTIPRGEVRSYSWVAQHAGRPTAIRAVGNICARNVVPFVVPCHRVVPAAGGVGNYAFGSPMKRVLLRSEGVNVDELDDLARRGVRFTGSKTTKIFCVPTCRDARRTRAENRVTFRDEDAARSRGFRPCKRCQPVAA